MAFGSSANLTFDILANDRASSKFDAMSRAARGGVGPLSGLGSKLKSLAKFGALAAVAVGAVAVKMGVDAVKAAAADEQAQALLAQTIRNNTKARSGDIANLEAWISKIGVATGVTDDELRPALQRLVTATKDVGEAQKLTSLAMDISAGTGKSLESVTTALMKAQNGSIAGLSRLGVKTKSVAGETMTLDQITKQLAETYGGAAATKADTFQGKMDRLKLVFDETKEAIGSKLIPVLTDLGTWFLEKGMPAISELSDGLSKTLGPAFAAVGDWIKKDLWPILQEVGRTMGEQMPGFIASLKQAFKDAQPAFKLAGEMFENVVGPALLWVGRHVIPIAASNIRLLGKAFGAIGNVFRFIWNNMMQPVFKFMIQSVGKALNALGILFQTLGKIPGAPAWIGKTGDALRKAADQANALANNIKKIPKRTEVVVHTSFTSSGRSGPGGTGGDLPGSSSGSSGGSGSTGNDTPRKRGGAAGRSSSKSDLDGMVLRVVGLDPGMKAYLATGGSGRYS